MIERVCDLVADATGVDPAEVRRRNFIQPEDFPYDTGVGMLPYDSGNYEPALDKALELVGYQDLLAGAGGARATAATASCSGSGSPSYVEVCGVAPSKWIGLPRRGLGRRSLGERQRPRPPDRQGRGHDRLAAARAGARDDLCPARRRRARRALRRHRRSSTPTRWARRSASARTAAARWRSAARRSTRASQKVKEKAKQLAAHMLEAARGGHRLRGRQGLRQGLAGQRRRRSRRSPWRPTSPTTCRRGWSRSSTRRPTTTRRTAPSRSARTSASSRSIATPARSTLVQATSRSTTSATSINPLIVDGQLHGGIAQGLAQALYEGAVLRRQRRSWSPAR